MAVAKIKAFKLFLCAILMTLIVFAFSSCNSESGEIHTPPTDANLDASVLLGKETYGVEIKPPVEVKNNLSELVNAPDVLIASSKGSDYVIIYGSLASYAKELSDQLYKTYRVDVEFFKHTEKSAEKEILIGETSRDISAKLVAAVNEASAGGQNYAWGYAVEGGKLAIHANGTYGMDSAMKEIYELFIKDEGFTLKEGLCVVKYKNIAEHKAEEEAIIKAEAEFRYKERLANAKNANNAFTLDDFGGSFTTDLAELAGKSFPSPEYYPLLGEHPRVNVNNDMLTDIKAALENTAFLNTTNEIKKLADTEFDGKFPDVPGKTYNYGDGSLLGIIEAKAFMYLVTGDELYGYEAIVAVKNAMLTMVTNKDQFIDPFRAYGLLMMIAAETYDWCNDLMTEADKQQFLAGIEHKVCLWDPANGIYNMEIGFPPTLLNGTNGHGTSVMLMRDYLAFAAAIYDDYPEWWNFIAGRFYTEFIEDFDFYFQSGMIHQGTSCYAPNKLYTYLWACWIINTLGGELPFKNDIDKVCLSLLGHIMPNGKLFQTGDGTVQGDGTTAGISYQCCLMSAALFKNDALAHYGHKYSNGYSTFTYSVGSNQWTPVMSIIFLANGVEFDEKSSEQMTLVQYNKYPLGQLIVRNQWSDDAAAVFMKIGELNAGNHDHKDSGTFQIYYKGMLSGTSGVYGDYGTAHWKYYQQATVSKNGLLVFDPARSAKEPIFDANGNITNDSTFLYTGSQRSNIDYDIVAKQTGVAYGYSQDGTSVEYAYIAGEISGAYDSATVKYMERNMLTVYTGDPDFPMFFFVYDDITSTSEDHIKKFLLHTTKEPSLSDEDGDGKNETVTMVNGDGKMVLTSLLGADSMTAIGGKGHAFEINGFNLTDQNKATGEWYENDYYERNWGRVEICATGSLESEFLNVIYVTDATQSEKLTPRLIENEQVAGAFVNNVAAIFTKGTSNATSEISFTTEGEGLVTYHVAGLKRGTWKVYADGEYLGTTYATKSASMVRFKASAGEITLKPGDDIMPANAGPIRYETAGGTLPSGTNDYYLYDTDTPLPDELTRCDDLFLGWFEDAEFTRPITSISADTRGPVVVYAKYLATLASETYDKQSDGCNTWVNLTEGATITPGAEYTSLATMSENSATFIFKIARKEDASILVSDCRLSVYNSTKCTIFTTSANGEVKLRGSTVIADLSKSDGFVTLRIVADFENSVFIAYDESGNVTHSAPMGLDGMEYKALLTDQIFNWRASSAGTLLIDEYKVIEGNLFKTDAPPCNHVDIDDDEKCDSCSEPFDDGIDLEGVHPIEYMIGDGVTLPDGYPKKFTEGESVILPIPTRVGYKFIGWYTDAEFTNPTAAVPENATEAYTVYPKFAMIMADMTEQSGKNSQFSFNGEGGKATVTYGQDGDFALINSSADGPSALLLANALSYAQMESSLASIIVTVAKDASNEPMPLMARTYLANKAKLTLFTTTSSGSVKFGAEELGNVSDGFVTIRIVIDFAVGELHAYDAAGNIIATRNFAYDQAWDGTSEDYQAALTSALLQIRSSGAGSIRIGNIGVYEGNIFDSKAELDDCSHRDADDNSKCDECGRDFEDGDEKPAEMHTVLYKNEFSEAVSGSLNYPYDASNVNNGSASFGGFWVGERVSARVEADGNGELFFQTVKNDSNTSGSGPNFNSSVTTPSNALASQSAKTLTYSLKLKRAQDDPSTDEDESEFMPIVLRIGDSAVASGINSSTGWLNVLNINSSAEVFIGGQKIATVGYSVTELLVSVDFTAGTISAYNELGELIQVSFAVPSAEQYKNAGINTTEDWLGIMNNNLFQIRTSGAGTVIYDEITVFSGYALA